MILFRIQPVSGRTPFSIKIRQEGLKPCSGAGRPTNDRWLLRSETLHFCGDFIILGWTADIETSPDWQGISYGPRVTRA
ncbi:hypothetical protein RRG08_022407 [Elysia crispata]|uniref:Uncharacterized protein n=1 Tax=Elysia crispata TaxID=231223 RepID=A0AAE0Z1K4_9GAST|nr:hypothetical protein RRG08_022407 [Elysia crispata]